MATERDSRSVSSGSSSTAVSVRDQQNYQTSTTPTPRSPSKRPKEHGSNIKVVVRCRGPSRAEVREGTPIVVAADGPRSEEVVVSDAGASSAPRTYQFDQVFGADADQSIIYQDVVVPILNEVFDGYSATLCAYGQTGTGKTYTMHGELQHQSSGALDANAGIVPRVITRLFQRLDKDYTDFAVSVSYIELYNEEIRDLLGPDNALPLQIFDEASKRGTVVKGLKEIPCKDVKSAIDILRQGNEKRQIAATKMNDKSSRSHSIFTISVTSATGSKDMFQMGKLNLVDLAGSENIGRSGAQDMRATEAGLINRSLLTLGRCINALVEKASKPNTHVPYRESVLTRVLQDALGGNTKTCIIATVSPVRANLEETLSTLDYATRARSIKNNPEATRKVAKHTLLKELVAEMDKLRADLVATREKNGRYFDEDRWEEMQAEQETLKSEHAESRRAKEVFEAQLLTLREEYEHNLLLLKRKDVELNEARDNLARTEDTLEATTRDLNAVTTSLEEEVVVRQVLEENGTQLDRVATGLNEVAKQGIADVHGLFDKLDRKSQVTASNISQVKNHEHKISQSIQLLTGAIQTHHQQQQSFAEELRTRAKEFHTSQSEALANDTKLLNTHISSLSTRASLILTKENASAELSRALAQLIGETTTGFRNDYATWSQQLLGAHEKLLGELEGKWVGQIGDASKMMQSFASLLEGIARDVQDYTEKERKSVLSLKSLTETAVQSEVQRLQHQNAELQKLVASEKAAAESMQADILSSVQKLLHKHTSQRETALRDASASLSSQLVDSQHALDKFKLNHGSGVSQLLNGAKDLGGRMERKASDGRKVREDASKALGALEGSVSRGVEGVRGVLGKKVQQHESQVEEASRALDAASSGTFERLEKGRRARVEEIGVMKEDAVQGLEYLTSALAEQGQAVDEAVTGIVATGSSLDASTEVFHHSADEQLAGLKQIARSLATRAAAEDLPTGQTPKKRKWEYEDEWQVVNDRATALQKYREKQHPPAAAPAVEPAETEEVMDEDAPTPRTPATPALDLQSLEPHEPEPQAYIEYEVPLAPEEDSPEPEPPAPAPPPSKMAAPTRRRAAATASSGAPTSKSSGIARPGRRVVSSGQSGSGPPGRAGTSAALAEKSNATSRKRDK